jgi:hypothetical protein
MFLVLFQIGNVPHNISIFVMCLHLPLSLQCLPFMTKTIKMSRVQNEKHKNKTLKKKKKKNPKFWTFFFFFINILVWLFLSLWGPYEDIAIPIIN